MLGGARSFIGRLLVLGGSFLILDASPLWAQARGAGSATAGSRPAAAESEAAGRVLERSVNLSRSQLDGLASQRPAATPGTAQKRRGLGAALGTAFSGALNGDEPRAQAAKGMLEAEASAEAALGRTVLVIIGSEGDRDKVRESLAEVQRSATILFVDDRVSDERYDNAALHGGLAGQVTGMATNLWVYFPSSGSSGQRKPNRVMSARVVSPALWTAVFAADGDVPPQLSNALDRQRLGPSRSAAGAPSPAARGQAVAEPGAVAEGDVLTPKIPGIRLLAEPAESAMVVAILAKSDQVVVIGGERNGYINVQGAAGSGWVNAKLFARP